MDSNEFVTTEEVVAEAIEYVNDADFTHGVGKSFYEMIVHRTIEDLALTTFFQKVTVDIFNWNCNKDFITPIPKNCFNVKELYVFNSSCDKDREADGCNCHTIANSDTADTSNDIGGVKHCCAGKDCWTYYLQAHLAVNFNRFGSTGIKTKKINNFILDPVDMRRVHHPRNTLVYFGMQNGMICMSDSAERFKNMRVVANGFGVDNCDLPIIPRPLRQACVDMVKYKVCTKLMVLFPEYRQMFQIYKLDLYGDNTIQNPGSWLKANRYVSSLNTKQREDLATYLGNITIK